MKYTNFELVYNNYYAILLAYLIEKAINYVNSFWINVNVIV